MRERLVRAKEVAEILGVARVTVWLWNKEGKIPKAFKLTTHCTVWRLSEIMRYVQDKQIESASE